MNFGSQKAAMATTNPSRAYFTARLTKSDISIPGVGAVLASGILYKTLDNYSMKHIRYTFRIDPDVIKEHSIQLPVQVGYYVGAYLNDPNGWAKYGYFFEPVESRESVLIRLSSPATIKKICGLPDNLSCAELGGRFMYLNANRWFHGAAASKLSLTDYRQYMISHEIGHILGHDHKKCPCKNCPAPIMMQQTKGIGECKPNTTV
jgi:hypothetical protein